MTATERPKSDPATFAPAQDAHGTNRRRRSQDTSTSTPRLWPIGVGIIFPVGALGITLIIVGLLAPDAGSGAFFRMTEFGVVGLLMLGLAMVLAGITPRSRRLRRPALWGAVLLAIVTIGGIVAVHIHARAAGSAVESPRPDSGD